MQLINHLSPGAGVWGWKQTAESRLTAGSFAGRTSISPAVFSPPASGGSICLGSQEPRGRGGWAGLLCSVNFSPEFSEDHELLDYSPLLSSYFLWNPQFSLTEQLVSGPGVCSALICQGSTCCYYHAFCAVSGLVNSGVPRGWGTRVSGGLGWFLEEVPSCNLSPAFFPLTGS